MNEERTEQTKRTEIRAHKERHKKPFFCIVISILCLLSCSALFSDRAAVGALLKKNSANATNKDRQSSSKQEDKLVTVPILYLTDRDEDKEHNYGSKRRYVVDCKHQMYYGTAKVVVQNSSKKDVTKSEPTLGWKEEKKEELYKVSCDQIEGDDDSKNKSEFFKRVTEAMERSGTDRICLFVHGADEGFNDAAADAASLAYSLEYPLILYSWPSVPKTFSYVVDGGNNEWSQGHFNAFLRQLLEYRKEHKIHLVIVSHSMGNRLVVRAAHLLEHTQLVKDAELLSPDIDAETFKHYILGLENQGAKIRLYTSSKDKMLPLSQMVYGGYYRLGEGVGEVFGTFSKHDKDDDKDDGTQTQKANSGANLPHHKQGLVERIDFTSIDTGIRGHSIPFDMLASMIHDDVPGPGLELVSAQPGKGSKLARFMSWSHHLGKVNDEGDSDLCKRIVKVDPKMPAQKDSK